MERSKQSVMPKKGSFKIIDLGRVPDEELPEVRAYFAAKNRLTKALKVYAADLSFPPRTNFVRDTTPKCRGEKLDPIIWEGRQWAVTDFGLETLDGTYVIGKDRIWENEEVHGWVAHMMGKVWVDGIDFAEALRVARLTWPEFQPKENAQ